MVRNETMLEKIEEKRKLIICIKEIKTNLFQYKVVKARYVRAKLSYWECNRKEKEGEEEGLVVTDDIKEVNSLV